MSEQTPAQRIAMISDRFTRYGSVSIDEGDLAYVIGRCRQHEDDLVKAAGECAIAIPEPGTDMARLLHANVMMRNYRIPELRARLGKLEKIAEALHPIAIEWANQGSDIDPDEEAILDALREAGRDL